MVEILNTYFEDLLFQYHEEKQSYAVYVAAINNQIGGDKQQCIFAFVPKHLGIKSTARLHELDWQNLQMRMVPSGIYKIKKQTWKAPITNKNIPEIMFSVVSREDQYSRYMPSISNINEFPFEVLMINSPKNKSKFQYPNTFNLHWAIDQFCTIFNCNAPKISVNNPNNFIDISTLEKYSQNSQEKNVSLHPLWGWSNSIHKNIQEIEHPTDDSDIIDYLS